MEIPDFLLSSIHIILNTVAAQATKKIIVKLKQNKKFVFGFLNTSPPYCMLYGMVDVKVYFYFYIYFYISRLLEYFNYNLIFFFIQDSQEK